MARYLHITVENKGNTVTLGAPFNPTIAANAKALGGKWDGRCWTFDARDEQRVRDLCRATWGSDGDDNPTLVTVRVHLDQLYHDSECWTLGRLIAERKGRDAAVRLGPQVILLEGGFRDRGGSAAHPDLAPLGGTVLEVRDVPAEFARAAADADPKGVVLIPSPSVDRRAALEQESVRLCARLREIERELAALDE